MRWRGTATRRWPQAATTTTRSPSTSRASSRRSRCGCSPPPAPPPRLERPAMKVSEAMSRDVEFLGEDAPVSEAAVMMGELEVGAVPVGTADRLLGILTDRDILYRVVAKGLDCS